MEYKGPTEKEISGTANTYRRNGLCFTLARARHFGCPHSHTVQPMSESDFQSMCELYAVAYQAPNPAEMHDSKAKSKLFSKSRRHKNYIYYKNNFARHRSMVGRIVSSFIKRTKAFKLLIKLTNKLFPELFLH